MKLYVELLLDVWREVGRHLEIQDSVDRIGPLIARRMPFESILVRVIDLERGRVETLVRAPPQERAGQVAQRYAEPSEAELEGLVAWWREGEPTRLTVETARRRLPGLLPRRARGRGFVWHHTFRCPNAGCCCALVGSTRPIPARARAACSRPCSSRWRWRSKAIIASVS